MFSFLSSSDAYGITYVVLHVFKLIVLLLSGSGGNSNVGNENHMTPLHRVCMYSHDSRLLHLLHENGADINAVDAEGSTPLLALCDSTTHQLYDISNDILPAVHEHSSTSGFLKIKVDFLDYLLQIKDLDVSISTTEDLKVYPYIFLLISLFFCNIQNPDKCMVQSTSYLCQ